MSSTDIEQLKIQLLNSQKLNQELHRRLQSCEGAATQLEEMKEKMREQTRIYLLFYRDERKYFRKKTAQLTKQIDRLPVFIRWVYKL